MRLFRSARWLMLALLVCLIPASSYAGIFISVNFGPPVLPVYVQPPCPAPDLMWTPGYWAYGGEGYYWVPGAWVPAPFIGGLWTPGYWGYVGGIYRFNPGYWGYHVGYYGGVNYGGGFLGIGFAGGEWRGGHMAYNTSVVNVNTTIVHTTFVDRTVIESHTVANPNHVAYAGGPGGVQHVAAPEEQIAAHETHTAPTSFQTQHENTAQQDKTSYAKNNGGHPTNLAVSKPLPVESHPAPPRTTTSVAGRTTPSTTSHSNVARDPQSGLPTGQRQGSTAPAATRSNLTQGGAAGSGGEGRTTQTPSRTMTTAPARTTSAPPRTNTAPKTPPPPPSKPKPNGHEK